ncbi:MAG: metallophosphoesterase [Planctomyces sp.]
MSDVRTSPSSKLSGFLQFLVTTAGLCVNCVRGQRHLQTPLRIWSQGSGPASRRLPEGLDANAESSMWDTSMFSVAQHELRSSVRLRSRHQVIGQSSRRRRSARTMMVEACEQRLMLSAVRPYLQNPAPDAMTVIWFTETNTSGTLNVSMPGGSSQTFNSTPEFRPELSYHASEATTSRSNAPYMHRIRVTGLSPATLYPYTVTQGSEVFNGQIRTTPGQSSSVRFMVYADSETEPESTGSSVLWTQPGNPASTRRYVADQTTGYQQNLSVIESRNPDFVGIAGDIVESGGEQRDWDEFWRHNAGDINDLASKVPILPAPGNHEDYGGPGAFGGYGDAGSIRGRDKYATYWETPSNGTPSHTDRYYRVDYGPITYISIDVTNGLPHGTSADTNWLLGAGPGYPDFNPGSVQYQWLEAQLADAQSKSRFTFVQLHHAPYSTGPHGFPAGNGAGFDNQSGQPVRVLTPLFTQYGVDAVFSGHDETYQHSIVNGIHFYDIGVGGDGLRGPSAGPDSANPTINTNPFQVFTAHLNAPEVWNGSQLVSGGKHYGHLEINVSLDSATGTWKAQLDPVHIFPLMNTTGQITGWERRVYNDSVTLTANAPPTSITLSPSQIAENLPANTPVGILSSADASGDTQSFQLVAGDGDTDNGAFMISGNQLIARQSFDFETKSQYSVRIRTTDQGDLFVEQSVSVSITDVADAIAPVLSGTGDTITWRVNTPPVLLFPSATVTDPDSPDFADGTLTLAYLSGGESTDELMIRSLGTGPGQISTGPAGTILLQGTPVGIYSGGLNGAPLVVNLTEAASQSAVQAILRNLTFRNTSQAPLNPGRTLRLQLTDGDGGTSLPVTKTITVTPVNDAPVIAGFTGSVTYVENASPVLFVPTAIVTDIDSVDFNTGKLTVGVSVNAHSSDRIGIRNQGTLAGQIGTSVSGAITTITFGGTTIGTATGTASMVVSLNSNATTAAVQALIRNITFATLSENPSTLTRTVLAVLTDGDGGTSLPVTKTITVTPVNDAPVIAGFGGTVPATVNGTPVFVASGAAVTDVDHLNFSAGALLVGISANSHTGDRLRIAGQGDGPGQIRVQANPLDGTLQQVFYQGVLIGGFATNTTSSLRVTLNSSATHPAVTALLKRVTYQNQSLTATLLPRTLTVSLTDGTPGATGTASKLITFSQPPCNA